MGSDSKPRRPVPARAPSPTPPASASRVPGVTWRSMTLGLLLVVANNWWLSQSEMRTQQTLLSGSSPFIGVIFIMFVVTLANWGVRRLAPAAALSQAELLVIYTMASISSCVGGVGAIGWFPTFLTRPFWNALHDAKWNPLLPLLPKWFGPRSEAVLKPFYEGKSTFFTPAHLHAWAAPLLLWGVFFFVLLSVTMCMMVLLRRAWVEHERLNFPIIYLPIEMTRTDSAGFLTNRLMWIGFVIPAVIHSLNSLNAIYPSLPSMQVNKGPDLGLSIVTAPWTGIGWLPLKFHAAVLGIGYVLSLDVSFSCWVFYFARKVMQVFGVAVGLRSPDVHLSAEALEFPYISAQAIGAWVAIALLSLWGMRGHLHRVWRKAVHGDPAVDDSQEPMSYRAALAAVVLGTAFLVAFCAWSGMSVVLPLAIIALFFIFMVALTRVRAESGVPASELMWVSPSDTLVSLGGTSAWGPRGLATISVLSWFNKDYRTAVMPVQLEAFKIGQVTRMRMRPMAMAMTVALAVAIAAAMIFSVNLYYTYGAETGKTYGGFVNAGSYNWTDLKGWLENLQPVRYQAILAAVFGGLVLAALQWVRLTWVGFPLNPSAFAFAMTYAIDFFWLDFLLAWAIKGLILRYGGMRLYRRAMPFFLGLILGEFVTSSSWTIVGAVAGLQLYRTFPN
jgi:hypothetical protein